MRKKSYAKLASVGVVEESKDFKNAVEFPQADRWKNEMEEEIDALVKNKTWTMTNWQKTHRQ
jgi:hypothetical protein